MLSATKAVEKQEHKMFCIFIFLTKKKKTKPEQKDGSIILEQDYTVESFYSKGKVVCSDHFHANYFEVDMMANVMGNTSKRRNLKSGAVPTIFKHKTYDMINMNGCKVKGKLQ